MNPLSAAGKRYVRCGAMERADLEHDPRSRSRRREPTRVDLPSEGRSRNTRNGFPGSRAWRAGVRAFGPQTRRRRRAWRPRLEGDNARRIGRPRNGARQRACVHAAECNGGASRTPRWRPARSRPPRPANNSRWHGVEPEASGAATQGRRAHPAGGWYCGPTPIGVGTSASHGSPSTNIGVTLSRLANRARHPARRLRPAEAARSRGAITVQPGGVSFRLDQLKAVHTRPRAGKPAVVSFRIVQPDGHARSRAYKTGGGAATRACI